MTTVCPENESGVFPEKKNCHKYLREHQMHIMRTQWMHLCLCEPNNINQLVLLIRHFANIYPNVRFNIYLHYSSFAEDYLT